MSTSVLHEPSERAVAWTQQDLNELRWIYYKILGFYFFPCRNTTEHEDISSDKPHQAGQDLVVSDTGLIGRSTVGNTTRISNSRNHSLIICAVWSLSIYVFRCYLGGSPASLYDLQHPRCSRPSSSVMVCRGMHYVRYEIRAFQYIIKISVLHFLVKCLDETL